MTEIQTVNTKTSDKKREETCCDTIFHNRKIENKIVLGRHGPYSKILPPCRVTRETLSVYPRNPFLSFLAFLPVETIYLFS